MTDLVLQILIIFLLVVANGALAMAEIAVVSARKARLQQMADEGNPRARAALELSAEVNRFLATVQVGITLVSILAGAFGGATIARAIAERLQGTPLARYGETIGVVIVVIGTTYLSLVIGELVPKQLALNNPERIATLVAAPMHALSRIASPLVWLLSVSTNAVIRLLGVQPSTAPPVTPEEIRVLVEQGTEIGIFEETEQDMIESVLELDERRIAADMTPRAQIVWFDVDEPLEEIRAKITSSQHSRFPVAQDTLDNVLGVVYAKDLLAQSLGGQPLDWSSVLRPPLFIPESMSALRVLEMFRQRGTHLALVIDEYGSVEGMVTHHDILETIVGYIPSAAEPVEPQALLREDGSWLIDGLLHIDKLKEILDLEELPGEEYGDYQTLAGFMLTQIRTLPTEGQFLDWEGLRFEVVDMDGPRIDKVLVARVVTPPSDPDQHD